MSEKRVQFNLAATSQPGMSRDGDGAGRQSTCSVDTYSSATTVTPTTSGPTKAENASNETQKAKEQQQDTALVKLGPERMAPGRLSPADDEPRPATVSPNRQRINIVLVTDLETPSVTKCHREAAFECVQTVCAEMDANLVLVEFNELDSGSSSAIDSFYNADAAILDISLEAQRNTLYYHLGVRESFSMKQNILVVANRLDNSHYQQQQHYFSSIMGQSTPPVERTISNSTPPSSTNSQPHCSTPTNELTHEAASQIKSTLPNYPLFVYFIEKNPTSNKIECFVNQQFVDLTYSPGSDEQMDPSIPDFEASETMLFNSINDDVDDDAGNTESPTKTNNGAISPSAIFQSDPSETGPRFHKRQIQTQDMTLPLNLVGQLKDALKNVKWQAKVHMKEKFLADLKKARELYQGKELYEILQRFRRRFDDPNMLNLDIVHQMLASFQEIQDYDSMIHLVDELTRNPSLIKIISSPLIVYKHAFALNRRRHPGDSDRALKIITTALALKEHQTPDSICLCGRIFKDRFIESSYRDRDSLRNAIDWYRKGFKISPNEYAAINLATLLYIAGHDFNSSNELRHVGLVLNNLIGRKGPVHKLENYWDVATYFEFCLLANQFSKAIDAAECMFNLNPSKWHLKSTIGNITLIYQFKPKQQTTYSDSQSSLSSANHNPGSIGGGCSLDTTASTAIGQELIKSPEEQIVEFWTEFFIFAVLDDCANEIRLPALVLEQNRVYMPTYVTMNKDAEEKSITISQMCINHLRDLDACRKPHLWHIKASGVRAISLYKRDERCVFLYVHDNSDDFQIFFPSEPVRAAFYAFVLSITGDRNVDMTANPKEAESKINFTFELDQDNNRIVLGRGSKGIVYAARDADTQTQIAVKEVPVKNIGEVQPLHEEIRLHSLLHHRNIVQYLGTSHEGSFFRIIMERVPGGSLSQLLQQQQSPLRENIIAFYSKQILDGLQYLHRQKIVHRDIKGDNVLVNKYTGTLKISDFGTCKRLASINPNTETFAGTVPFMAPELLDRGQRGYSMPADIWSFGCTVVEMATGKPPFIDVGSGAQVMFRVGFYKEHPRIPAHLSDKCKQFVLRCFEPNPDYRVTCDELLTHPFLDEVRTSSALAINSLGATAGSSCSSTPPTPSSPLSSSTCTIAAAAATPSAAADSADWSPSTKWHVSPRGSPQAASPGQSPSPATAVSRQAPHCAATSAPVFWPQATAVAAPATSPEATDGNATDDDEADQLDDEDSPTLVGKTPPISASVGRLVLARRAAPPRLILPKSALMHSLSRADQSTSALTGDIGQQKQHHQQNAAATTAAAAESNSKCETTTAANNKLDEASGAWVIATRANDRSCSTKDDNLIEANERLAHANRQLWERLYQVQSELRVALEMQLADKRAQLEVTAGKPSQFDKPGGADGGCGPTLNTFDQVT